MTIIWYGILSQGAPYNPIGQLCLGIFHPKKKKKKWINKPAFEKQTIFICDIRLVEVRKQATLPMSCSGQWDKHVLFFLFFSTV